MRKFLSGFFVLLPSLTFASNEIGFCKSSEVCRLPSGCFEEKTSVQLVVLDDIPRYVVYGAKLVELIISEETRSAYWEYKGTQSHIIFEGNNADATLVRFPSSSERTETEVIELSCGELG